MAVTEEGVFIVLMSFVVGAFLGSLLGMSVKKE